MFWNKKKEGLLPDLPPLKDSFDIGEEIVPEKKELPEFPDVPVKKDQPVEKPIEVEEWVPKTITKERYEPHYPTAKETKRSEIYVKIDKFRSAKKEMNIVKDKIDEIDDLLRKIRETKMREEQELSSWEKEVAAVRSRIQNVAVNIFEKVE